jgi:hypothetical protein
MKNILTGRIDYLNFKDGETVRSTRVIRATRSIVAKLIYIYIYLFIFLGLILALILRAFWSHSHCTKCQPQKDSS